VVETVADAGAILIPGPANAKTELVKHIHHHDAALMGRIKGIIRRMASSSRTPAEISRRKTW
jgi:hypothetical protein